MFERFTAEARNTVLMAQEEARSLGHDYIGTEHILLALVAVDAPPVGVVLAPYGITRDAVRADILGIVGRGEGAGAGHIPFTPRSKKVLELSLREALKLKHKTIEPAHILLGLIREGEGVAAQILVQHSVDLRRLRGEIAAHMGGNLGKGRFSIAPPTVPAMTRGGVAAFDRARELAAGGAVGSQHVLLGLLGEDESLAAKVLAALGVTREAAEQQLAQLDPSGTFDELPEHAAAHRTSFEVDENVVTVRLEDPDLAAKLRAAMREPGRPVVISGTEIPDFDRFWRSVRPALEDMSVGFSKQVMARRLRETEDVTLERLQTAWAVADYIVMSTPVGLRSRLLPNSRFTTDDEVRAFLRRWLTENQAMLAELPGPYRDAGCVSFSLQLTRAGAVQPDARDPDALAVANIGYGPGPAPPDRPRVPLADLVAFAISDLGAGEQPRSA